MLARRTRPGRSRSARPGPARSRQLVGRASPARRRRCAAPRHSTRRCRAGSPARTHARWTRASSTSAASGSPSQPRVLDAPDVRRRLGSRAYPAAPRPCSLSGRRIIALWMCAIARPTPTVDAAATEAGASCAATQSTRCARSCSGVRHSPVANCLHRRLHVGDARPARAGAHAARAWPARAG